MGNRIILIGQITTPLVSSLEVYRDISMDAVLNQANIWKSYKEIIPLCCLGAGRYTNKVYAEIRDAANLCNMTISKLSEFFVSGDYHIENYGVNTKLSVGDEYVIEKLKLSELTSFNIEGIDICVGNCLVITNNVTVKDIKPTDISINTNFIDHIPGKTIIDNKIIYSKLSVLQGEITADNFPILGFDINVQVSDAYYEAIYNNDLSSFTLLLKAEQNTSELTGIRTEKATEYGKNDKDILLFMNQGQVSSMQNYKESLLWNPYKLEKIINVKAVLNSIHNIFTWTPGERILDPNFGTNLRKLLYLGITEFTSEQIVAEIRRCINEYEPRVLIQQIKNVSTADDTENNTIRIDIIFTIPTLSDELYKYTYIYDKFHVKDI